MGAATVLHDVFRSTKIVVPDPGNGGTINVDRDRQNCELTSLAASGATETRTLNAPGKSGILTMLNFITKNTYGITVTVNDSAGGTTTVTFTTQGTMVIFMSCCTSQSATTGVKTFAWKAIFSNA